MVAFIGTQASRDTAFLYEMRCAEVTGRPAAVIAITFSSREIEI